MALIVNTENAEALLNKIVQEFNGVGSKDIDTWDMLVKNGSYYFTHNRPQFKNKTYFKAYIYNKNLVFGILYKPSNMLTVDLYGIYHGRFSQMLLNHFDFDLKSIETISLISDLDIEV